jgi:RNA polymerase sigma factor (sigma-70 family)
MIRQLFRERNSIFAVMSWRNGRRRNQISRKTLSDFLRSGYLIGEMQPKSDAQLLREYAESGSESAFTELVTRHTDLVYSAALRQVPSSDLACDIAQNVFTSLARGARTLAGKLNPDASLAGWLCRCTRNLALNLRRDDFRRHSRERQAMENLHPSPETAPDWDRLCPILDEAISGLNEADHDALVLRFFKNQDLRSVGLALGVSDDTAQKQASRALEKLREYLAHHGITRTGAALAMAISANAVQAAPASVAATISTAAVLAGTAVQTSTVIAATKAIAMTTLQKTLITAIIAAAVGTGIYEARQVSNLRSQVQTLQQQQAPLAEQVEQLTRDRDDATNKLAALRDENDRLNRNTAELLKLRGEIGRLREDNRKLRTSLANAAPNSTPEADSEGEQQKAWELHQLNNAKQFVMAMTLYANDNQGQFPSNFYQTAPYLGGNTNSPALTQFNQFEIVYQGSTNIANPSSVIVVRDKEASISPDGKWQKTYGFADGHSEVHVEANGNFTPWEQKHMVSSSPNQ